MATYKLTYFNSRGTAEPSRFVFAQAGVKYEDVRVDHGEQWKELKPNTPFGVLPLLEEDGKQLGGSTIIARYLGEKFGLAGENAFENALLANVVDAAMDLLQELGIAWFEKDEDRKQKAVKKLKEESIPTKLKLFDSRVAGNENGLLTGKPTWADFFLYMTLDFVMMTAGNEVLKDYPGLTKLRASVEALPNIAKWIKERPVTDN